jgi:hypothetical protein
MESERFEHKQNKVREKIAPQGALWFMEVAGVYPMKKISFECILE